MDRRNAVVDAALSLLVFAVTAGAMAAGLGDNEAPPRPSTYLWAPAFAALVLVRRRRPVTLLLLSAVLVVGYHALDNPPLPLALPVGVALYTAAEYGRAWWAAGTAAALLVVATVARIREGDSLAVLFGYDLISQASLMAAIILLGDVVRSRRRWRAELGRQAAAAAADRDREAARRVEEERLRIARQLHDELAHTLSVISLHTDVARESLDDAAPAAAGAALARVRDAVGGAARELRATVGLLRADAEPAPGLSRLGELVGACGDTGLRVDVVTDGDFTDVPAVVGSTAYRIVQEALTNVRRHADAGAVTVTLRCAADALTVRIRDDGRGGAPAGSGHGLTGMRERAALLGGTLAAGPTATGWEVSAVLPLRGAA